MISHVTKVLEKEITVELESVLEIVRMQIGFKRHIKLTSCGIGDGGLV